MKIYICTPARLKRARSRVANELRYHGVWNDRVEEIDVRLVGFRWYALDAYGWQHYGGCGSIDIPAFSLPRMAHWLGWKAYLPLTDVLRHEYGHAIADTHRGLIRSRRFTHAFGASHNSGIASEYDPSEHVDPCASLNPCEDFAEIVTVFLRSCGRLPKRFNTPAIGRKWQFVRQLFAAIGEGQRKW